MINEFTDFCHKTSAEQSGPAGVQATSSRAGSLLAYEKVEKC